jgi:uncharacterized membrane protein
MEFNFTEWLNLVARWVHVFAGILWVGQTYYFTWLDGRLHEEENVWMVHSGGFYSVEKKPSPKIDPARLHWFRWEAALTWLSGVVLLVLVYYMGGLMVDADVADISTGRAVGIGVGAIVLAWIVYDVLWLSPLAKSETLGAAVSFALLVAAAYGLTQIFSGRAAYMHIGAMLGTIMAANVWERILPAQRRLVAALAAGTPPDAALAARAKLRSKHNTFMAVPVVVIMISNHFPIATFGSRYNWIVLSVLVLVGWAAAKLIRRA